MIIHLIDNKIINLGWFHVCLNRYFHARWLPLSFAMKDQPEMYFSWLSSTEFPIRLSMNCSEL